MIANLILLVLKTSFLFVNGLLVLVLGCSGSKKSPSTPPTHSTLDSQPSRTEKNAGSSTMSTEKEPSKVVPNAKSVAAKPQSKMKNTSCQKKQTQVLSRLLSVEKTQMKESKKTVRPPVRSREAVKAQRTLKDVQEVDAPEGPLAGEASVNQQEFDDYLNNLGGGAKG
ncbi:unnamed protein product [Caenorhabditis sp. 36 PRJEB53466]|nr:unnamed protein product [Caenorhabditis sp. 36 PRJEB53466]